MSITINHDTNDLSATGSGSITIDGATPGGGGGGSLTTAAISGASQTVDFTKDIVTSTVASKTTTYAFSGASAVDQTTLIIDNNYSEPATTGDVRILNDQTGNPWVGSATPIYKSAPMGMTMSNDGTKLYSGSRPSSTENYVRCWTLSTPFDVSTSSTTFTSKTINSSVYIRGMQISPDGLKLALILSGSGQYLAILTMTTANDLSTVTGYDNYSLDSRQSNYLTGLAVSQNGQHYYILDNGWDGGSSAVTRKIVYYTASGWGDTNGLTFSSVLDVWPDNSRFILLQDCQISADGTRLLVQTARPLITTYLLSTAYDLSTATKYEAAVLPEPSASSFIYGGPTTGIYDSNSIHLTSGGDRLYLQYDNAASDIASYKINGSITLVFPSGTEVPTPFVGTVDANIPLTINPSKGTKTALQLSTVDTGSTYQVTGVAESIE